MHVTPSLALTTPLATQRKLFDVVYIYLRQRRRRHNAHQAVHKDRRSSVDGQAQTAPSTGVGEGGHRGRQYLSRTAATATLQLHVTRGSLLPQARRDYQPLSGKG